jgi:hypothetical protein
MPLLRLIPFRLLLVLGAGLVFAFCGQGLGLWTGERGASTSVGDNASNARDADRSQQAAKESPAKEPATKAVQQAQREADAKRAEEDAAAARAADSDRDGALLARDRDLVLRIDALVSSVQQGSFHAACEALAELDVAAQPSVAEALRVRCSKLGWPELHGDVREPAPWTRAEFSLQGRLVRAAKDSPSVRVLAHDATSVTLRVPSPLGVTFPKIAAHRIEPDAVRADEATELGYTAYGNTDYTAARVWCAIAIARSAAPNERVQQLKALLR